MHSGAYTVKNLLRLIETLLRPSIETESLYLKSRSTTYNALNLLAVLRILASEYFANKTSVPSSYGDVYRVLRFFSRSREKALVVVYVRVHRCQYWRTLTRTLSLTRAPPPPPATRTCTTAATSGLWRTVRRPGAGSRCRDTLPRLMRILMTLTGRSPWQVGFAILISNVKQQLVNNLSVLALLDSIHNLQFSWLREWEN